MNLLVIDFVNSQWYNTHDKMFEPLRDEEWVAMLFKLWNIPFDKILSEIDIRELIALREWLFSVIKNLVSNNCLKAEDISTINKYFERSKVNIQLNTTDNGYYLNKVPENNDWNWVISSILLSLTTLLMEYEVSRIKICENPKCRIVFYDNSKSRTKKFCHSTCANVVKVRRHRLKQNNANKD